MARIRDYKAEYAKRKASGQRRGLTTAQARGHREVVPGGKSEYRLRAERRATRDLNTYENRNENIPDMVALLFRVYGVAGGIKVLDARKRVEASYRTDFSDAYLELQAALADVHDREHSGDYVDYDEIDFGHAPDYAVFLFYH